MRIRAKMALLALPLGGGLFPSPAAALATEIFDIAEPPSPEAIQIANRVAASGDSGGLPFIVIDKVAAAVLVYNAQGELLGATPALLGVARGDETVPGIGDRELSSITPEQRTTPAGRFWASFGAALGMRKVLWVDYSSSIALHPVVRGSKNDRRRERLQSPSSQDNRITYGCINISNSFFEKVVVPTLGKSGGGVVYTLPEIKSLQEAFPSLVIPPAGLATAASD